MATLTNFGIPAVGTGHNLLQPKLGFKWELEFLNLGAVGQEDRIVSLAAQSVDRPSGKFAEYKVARYNGVGYGHGRWEWNPIKAIFMDDITNKATSVIQKQIDRQQNLLSGGPYLAHAASAGDVKFGMIIRQLDGNDQAVEEWRLEGCLLMDINAGTLDYEQGDQVMKYEIQIRFDAANQVFASNLDTSGLLLGGAAPTGNI
jgi:hypothetical protein